MPRPVKWIVGIIGAVILAALVFWLVTRSPSTWSVSALWFLGAAALIGVAVLISTRPNAHWTTVSKAAQDLVPLLTIAGVFIATGLYFLERRDKFRISFALESSVVRLTPGESEEDRVLLTIRVPIENKGARQITVRCMSLAIMHPPRRGIPARSRDTMEEMQLEPISDRIDYRTPDSVACRNGEFERARARGRAAPGRPLFIWPAFSLEPGDVDDRYFEIPISCDYAFVRVLVKIRTNPEDPMVIETKTLVPLADICRGERDSSRGMSTPVLEGGTDEGGGAATPNEVAVGNATK